MGANMAQRLARAQHDVTGYDPQDAARRRANQAQEGPIEGSATRIEAKRAGNGAGAAPRKRRATAARKRAPRKTA